MASNLKGVRPHKQNGGAILTITPPFVETTLAAGDFNIHHAADATHFFNDLSRSRNRWDIERRCVGLISGKRLRKRDADAALKRALQVARENEHVLAGRFGQ